MKAQLPDKDWLTFTELARRWQCTEDDIRHYIFEQRSLKASVKLENRLGDKYVDQYNYKSLIFDLGMWAAGVKSDGPGCVPERKLRASLSHFKDLDFDSYTTAKKYYFLNPKYLFDYLKNDKVSFGWGTDFLEDNEGRVYRLFQKFESEFYYTMLDVKVFSIVLTGEINRFEEANGIEIAPDESVETNGDLLSVASSTLQVQREEFFKNQCFCKFKPGRRKGG